MDNPTAHDLAAADKVWRDTVDRGISAANNAHSVAYRIAHAERDRMSSDLWDRLTDAIDAAESTAIDAAYEAADAAERAATALAAGFDDAADGCPECGPGAGCGNTAT